MDMMGVRDHIDLLMNAFRPHRDGADRVFSEDAIPEVKTLAEERGIDLTMPRRCARQVHRPNVGGSIEEYVSPHHLWIPWSLEGGFGESNTPYFHFFALHPREMQQTERDEFKHIVSSVKVEDEVV